jgi:hypothetical protein
MKELRLGEHTACWQYARVNVVAVFAHASMFGVIV